MEVSDEINACSVEIEVDVNGVKEPWLLMFKNETHNHPTEIEPFGGAATCIGGAIRDPLSGRSLRLPSHAYFRCWRYYSSNFRNSRWEIATTSDF